MGSVEFLGGFRDLFRSFLRRFSLVLGQFWQKKFNMKHIDFLMTFLGRPGDVL